MHFLGVFFVNAMRFQAHRFKLTSFFFLLCFKMKCTDKNQMKSNILSRSTRPKRSAGEKSERWAESCCGHFALCLFYPNPHLQVRDSFIWCSIFLLPILCLLSLGSSCWCCCFLGVVFRRVVCGSSCGGRGLRGLRVFWGRVGRMSPTSAFIPSWGWVTSPPASLLSHWGLWTKSFEWLTSIWHVLGVQQLKY